MTGYLICAGNYNLLVIKLYQRSVQSAMPVMDTNLYIDIHLILIESSTVGMQGPNFDGGEDVKNWKNIRLTVFLLLLIISLLSAIGCNKLNPTTLNNQSVLAPDCTGTDGLNSPASFGADSSSNKDISSATLVTPSGASSNSSKNGDIGTNSSTPANTKILDESTFEVHFIDVGQADAALVLCNGQSMLIDGGNAADSDLIYAYLKKLKINHLDYMVCTHAHEDHVGGLAGALNYASADIALCPVTSYDSKAFRSFVTYLEKQNVSITVPAAGDSFSLGGASVEILGPIHSSADPNNISIVLRVVYGETSFLFTGDAERDEEQDIINAGYTLDSTVLKVGHHGSDTSTSYVFLREIMPKYAVISVGKDNSYGHPTEEVLSRLRDADVKVYRTDMQGDVICTSDGKTASFSVSRNSDADTLASVGPNSTQKEPGSQSDTSQPAAPDTNTKPTESNPVSEGADYILNTNTHKFHYPNCSSVKQMAEKNKQTYSGTRDEIISMGYDPCGRCHP